MRTITPAPQPAVNYATPKRRTVAESGQRCAAPARAAAQSVGVEMRAARQHDHVTEN
jgi:hypothetical protein